MSPRSGSELLCEALAATGVAGQPTEHFWNFDGIDYPERFGVSGYREALEHIYQLGSTPNGVFGVKFGIEGEFFRHVVRVVREALSLPENMSAAEVIREGFPGLRIIWLTRRNKVRQAVSWARAIQEDVYHVWDTKPEPQPAVSPEYRYGQIDHLIQDLVLREASHQAFLESLGGPPPLTIVYEDFVADYENTVRRCLKYLELPVPEVIPAEKHLVRQANVLNEEWVQRYRREKQERWQQKAWLPFDREEEPLSSVQREISRPSATAYRSFEILEVENLSLDDSLVFGGHVGHPKPGIRNNLESFDVVGWFLGKQLPSVRVEVIENGRQVGEALLDRKRPDIESLFPDAADSGSCGFQFPVAVAELPAEFELLVQGVLENGQRVPLAKVRGRRILMEV